MNIVCLGYSVELRDILMKYMVLTGSFITQFMVVGVLFSYGVLMNEFEIQFGWPRAVLSTAS